MGDVTIAQDATPEEVTQIADELEAYGQEKTGGRLNFPGEKDPGFGFSIAVVDAEGEVAGGLNVSSFLGFMWLELLWTSEAHRRRGIASWLILEAERIALENGCIGAGTWTLNWQGADFYPRIGFQLNGVFDGYPEGTTEHVLTKRLPSSTEVQAHVLSHIDRNIRDGYQLVASPTDEQMALVRQGLRDHSKTHVGDGMGSPGVDIHLALRDGSGRLVGGLVASTPYWVMALEQLWIHEDFRGRGHGRALVETAEEIASGLGCKAVQSWAFSMHTPSFFRHMGYASFGIVDGLIDGYTEDLLIKRLDAPAESRPSP